jgi:Ca2+-binding RTX toxin-like protein
MAKGGGASAARYSINGTQGDDFIDGSTYSATLQARGLDISGGGGNDHLKGGSGADSLSGGNGNDVVLGDLADLTGAGGNSKIVWDGGNGVDTLDLSGLAYAEGKGILLQAVSNTASASNQIWTNIDKNDASVWGATSYDAKYLNNFQGFENFVMGDGNDEVHMANGMGNNVIWGGGGNDFLTAADGNDTVYAGDGNDIIDGGWGNDTLYGGAGNDAFTIGGRLAGQYTYDVIKDFDLRTDASDTSYDAIIMGGSWTISWDPNSPAVLHGYLIDGSTVFGEITLEGLTYADASLVTMGTSTDTGDLIIP